MWKKLFLVMSLATILLFAGCSSESADTSALSEEEISAMLTDADQFSGRTVEKLPLLVSQVINKEEGNYQYQAWTDEERSNSVIFICEKDFDIEYDDYILLTGAVDGMEEFEKALDGTTVNVPLITATNVKKSDGTIFNPAEKTIKVNEVKSQHGIKVKLEKIEFAKKSTRVYVKVTNDSGDKINLYQSDSYIKYGNKQYYLSEISYEETTLDISSMIPGTDDEGLLSFEPIKISSGSMEVSLTVGSGDWDIELSNFSFTIEVQ